MAYTTIDDPGIYFNTLLYTGNGATSSAGTTARTLTGVGFQPDWVWVKERSNTEGHFLQDSVRGASKVMFSNLNNAEVDSLTDYSDGGLNGFISDGFTIGSGHAGNSNNINTNSETYVAWNWKAGGSASNNTDGSITTSVNVNQTAGFSIITYTGSNSDTTIGHGLGVKPNLFIIKSRSNANAWIVGGDKIGSDNNGTLMLAETDAASSVDTNFNNTAPTSSVITLRNTNSQANRASYTYVCYAFANVKGYSKFGSYTGNGNADGPFVYTGFKPAFLIIKPSSKAEEWMIMDAKRDPENAVDSNLYANQNYAEADYDRLDIVSNGFKVITDSGHLNTSGATMIYMAFAESPFVNSNGVPTNAR